VPAILRYGAHSSLKDRTLTPSYIRRSWLLHESLTSEDNNWRWYIDVEQRQRKCVGSNENHSSFLQVQIPLPNYCTHVLIICTERDDLCECPDDMLVVSQSQRNKQPVSWEYVRDLEMLKNPRSTSTETHIENCCVEKTSNSYDKSILLETQKQA